MMHCNIDQLKELLIKTNLKDNFDYFITKKFNQEKFQNYFMWMRELSKEKLVYDYYELMYDHVFGTDDDEFGKSYIEMINYIKEKCRFATNWGLDNYYLSITNQHYASTLELDEDDINLINEWFNSIQSYISSDNRDLFVKEFSFLKLNSKII